MDETKTINPFLDDTLEFTTQSTIGTSARLSICPISLAQTIEGGEDLASDIFLKIYKKAINLSSGKVLSTHGSLLSPAIT